MCGIAGFIGQGGEQDARRMIETLRHRGPDDTGVYAEPGVALAHARLSIIDTSAAGHEPMWNASHTAVLVFNGEIYNFEELRKREVPDYPYHGHSDAEVILALYDKLGVRCLGLLNGMFAIALYDTRAKTLYLARDRMGKKPLYIGRFDSTLAFASEPKALFAHTRARKEIDIRSVNEFLALDYVPTPHSIWRDVEKLPPATVLTYKAGQATVETYWRPDATQSDISVAEAERELDATLSRAVASRLVSDVPLGVLLSGGLDSSAIAYYAQQSNREPLHTFSIGFEEASFDESRYAREVAEHLGTLHHHEVASAEDALDALPRITATLDEPLADASIIPTYLLSQFVRRDVTVALGGDGGDELFAGYPTFQADAPARLYRAMPGLVQSAATSLARLVPESRGYASLKFRLDKFLEGARASDPVERHLRWLGTFSHDERAQLFSRDAYREIVSEDAYAGARAAFDASAAPDPRNKLLAAYERSYLMDQVLVKVDRASMANALEVRAPFLDYELVEFAHRLPYRYKLHGLTTKYLLKRLMRGKLPRRIIHRKKQGFAVPVGEWMNGPLRELTDRLLAPEALAATGLFKPDYVQQLLAEHRSGARDHRKRLWNLLSFMMWYDAWA